MDHDKRRQRDEQDERDAYGELSSSEQTAIRFLLDCAASRRGFIPVRKGEWIAENRSSVWQFAVTLAAYECLSIVPRVAAHLADAKSWTGGVLNATIFFGEASAIAEFCISNGFLQTFAGFDFLFVRIFGGAARPLTPSLFAAAVLHPNVHFAAMDSDELEKAVWARQSEWGVRDPVWFPNHPIPPLVPIPRWCP